MTVGEEGRVEEERGVGPEDADPAEDEQGRGHRADRVGRAVDPGQVPQHGEDEEHHDDQGQRLLALLVGGDQHREGGGQAEQGGRVVAGPAEGGVDLHGRQHAHHADGDHRGDGAQLEAEQGERPDDHPAGHRHRQVAVGTALALGGGWRRLRSPARRLRPPAPAARPAACRRPWPVLGHPRRPGQGGPGHGGSGGRRLGALRGLGGHVGPVAHGRLSSSPSRRSPWPRGAGPRGAGRGGRVPGGGAGRLRRLGSPRQPPRPRPPPASASAAGGPPRPLRARPPRRSGRPRPRVRLRAPHRRDDHGVVVGQRDLFGRAPAVGLAGGRQVEGPGLALTGLRRLVQGAVALLVVGQHRVLERLLVGLPVGVLLPPGGPGHRRPRVGTLALVGPAPGEHRGHLAGRRLGPVGQLGPAGLDGGRRPRPSRRRRARRHPPRSPPDPSRVPAGSRADDPHPPGTGGRRLLFCVVLVVHLTPLRPRAAPSPCGTGAARPQPPAGG